MSDFDVTDWLDERQRIEDASERYGWWPSRDASRLIAALRAVVELHHIAEGLEHPDGGPVCDGCGDEFGWASAYPCPTVQAIRAALEGGS